MQYRGGSGGTQPYGIDINPIDGSVWYTRLFADKVGRIDADTLEVSEYDSPIRGPRRMHFDKKGMLWLSGYSEGMLARIEPTDEGIDSKVYPMPEFAPGFRPAPYALGVHPVTQEIWLNENMTDRLYRFIPSEERFVVYPIPLRGTYTRDFSFSPDGKVCASNNPFPLASLEGGRVGDRLYRAQSGEYGFHCCTSKLNHSFRSNTTGTWCVRAGVNSFLQPHFIVISRSTYLHTSDPLLFCVFKWIILARILIHFWTCPTTNLVDY